MASHSQRQPQPDRPTPFGYKIAWLALRTTQADAVALALGMTENRMATWADGVAAAYESASVFVTPPLAGWTLATGVSLFPPDGAETFVKPLLERLSRVFGDAQYFCTHRVVETHLWARALAGRLVRGYGWTGEKGITLWDEETQTEEERELGFQFFDERFSEIGQRDYFRKDLTFPSEEHVMRLAQRWSINPNKLDEQFSNPGLGLLGQFRPDPWPMPELNGARTELLAVLQAARSLLALPGNDFAWSRWGSADEALRELDQFIALLRAGVLPERGDLTVLFAPTGSIQEVSVSSGWGIEFLAIAARFDAACTRAFGGA